MNTEIKSQIRKFIVTTWLNGDDRGLKDDTDLQESGLLDSLSTLALISFLEDTFQIQVNPADIHAETFQTLDAIATLISSKGIKNG